MNALNFSNLKPGTKVSCFFEGNGKIYGSMETDEGTTIVKVIFESGVYADYTAYGRRYSINDAKPTLRLGHDRWAEGSVIPPIDLEGTPCKGQLCIFWADGIGGITGFHEDNPVVDLFRYVEIKDDRVRYYTSDNYWDNCIPLSEEQLEAMSDVLKRLGL